jgi:hypothetical protein
MLNRRRAAVAGHPPRFDLPFNMALLSKADRVHWPAVGSHVRRREAAILIDFFFEKQMRPCGTAPPCPTTRQH